MINFFEAAQGFSTLSDARADAGMALKRQALKDWIGAAGIQIGLPATPLSRWRPSPASKGNAIERCPLKCAISVQKQAPLQTVDASTFEVILRVRLVPEPRHRFLFSISMS